MHLNAGNNKRIDIIKKKYMCVCGIKAKASEGIVAYYYSKESNTEYLQGIIKYANIIYAYSNWTDYNMAQSLSCKH